jgi:MSHA biogenesis protein MshJ
MRAKYKKLLESIDSLSLRERLFVFIAMLVVVGGAWEAFLAAPLQAREARANEKVEATRQQLAELSRSIELAAQGIGGGMSDHYERLKILREQVAAGEEAVRIFTSDLVDPAQMRFVLEDLIDRQRGLALISISNLDVRPLIEPEGGDDARGAGPQLYRHGLVIVLEGSYLDCLGYLSAVERLPWQLYWGRFHLETEEHPRSRISIELHTLSLEEEWIGV